MNRGPTILDACGCCKGIPPETPRSNRPGLPALAYRVGTYSSFFARMLDRIHAQQIPGGPNAGTRPLAALTTRSADDPAISLIDAWATTVDVLAFYQERIANEGFLRSATERRSVLELARAIGYELNPGVAASAYLAFNVEDHVGNPGKATIAAGTKVQSVPAQGKLPQTFETSATIAAQAEWNALLPRLSQPQHLALYKKDLYLLGLTTAFSSADDVTTILKADFGGIYPLFESTSVDAVRTSITALKVSRIHLAGTALNLKSGDRLLLVGKSMTNDVDTLVKVVHASAEDAAAGTTSVDLAQETAAPPFQPLILETATSVAYGKTSFTKETVTGAIFGDALSEGQLYGVVAENMWSFPDLYALANYRSPPRYR